MKTGTKDYMKPSATNYLKTKAMNDMTTTKNSIKC